MSMLPVLLYRATCGKCRVLSLLLRVAALGRLQRVPIASAEADLLYSRRPGTRGRLALVRNTVVITGPPMAVALLRHVLETWALPALAAVLTLGGVVLFW